MKYLVLFIGVAALLAIDPPYLFGIAHIWIFGWLILVSHKRTEEYKILERKDGFGTTYIPVLVQHNTLLWWKWGRYGFVHSEWIDENPDKHTYFDGAKFVIEEYKRFLEKSKVKIEISERDIS